MCNIYNVLFTYEEIMQILHCSEKDAKKILEHLRVIQLDQNLISPENTIYSYVFDEFLKILIGR